MPVLHFCTLHSALCTLHLRNVLTLVSHPQPRGLLRGGIVFPHTIYMPRQWRTVSIPHGAVRNFFSFSLFWLCGKKGASQHSGGWPPHCCSVCCQEGIVLSLRPLSCTSPPLQQPSKTILATTSMAIGIYTGTFIRFVGCIRLGSREHHSAHLSKTNYYNITNSKII